MIKCVSDIMLKDFTAVNVLDGIQKVRNLVLQKGVDFFPVYDNGRLVGILTYRDLIATHPNRIVADAMSSHYIEISPGTPFWKAKENFEKYDIEVLLAVDGGELKGLISRPLIESEMGKHIDLLTGLYKSNYIYYHAAEMIERETEVSIIFLDIDNFSHIDKKYGHIKGDTILKEVSKLLKENVPGEAFLCRFGGDEFVVLAPYARNACSSLAVNLINAIASYSYPDGIDVSIAAGISGGKKYIKKNLNPNSIAINLINLASLASTRAKKDKRQLFIAEDLEAGEIA